MNFSRTPSTHLTYLGSPEEVHHCGWWHVTKKLYFIFALHSNQINLLNSKQAPPFSYCKRTLRSTYYHYIRPQPHRSFTEEIKLEEKLRRISCPGSAAVLGGSPRWGAPAPELEEEDIQRVKIEEIRKSPLPAPRLILTMTGGLNLE